MQDWIKVVTEPLGLAGFALFLVFGVLARVKKQDERRWLGPLASGMAVLALVGGLTLAYVKASHSPTPQGASTPTAKAPAPVQTNQVEQTTTGKGSPAVQGVQGDVNITVDQSSGTYDKKALPHKNSEKTSK